MTSPPTPAPSRLRRRLLRTGLVLGSAAAALLAAEFASRAAGLAIPPRGESNRLEVSRRVSADEAPGLLYALIPGARDEVVYPGVGGEPERVVEYRINSLGFRDREYPREQTPGALRIAVLGDSFTFGTGVNLEDTLPKALERALAAERAPQPVEVMNWGVYGYNLGQQAALLERWIDAAEPDLVLVVAYVNDASGENRGAASGAPAWEARLITALGLTSGLWTRGEASAAPPAFARTMALRRHSVLADVLAHRLYRVLHGRVTVRNYREDWLPGSPGRQMVERALDRMADLCRDRGVPLHVAFYPDLHQLDENYPFRAAHAAVGALCAERGLPYHDLFEVLEGLAATALHAHAHDHHPNGRCHALVGAALARALASD